MAGQHTNLHHRFQVRVDDRLDNVAELLHDAVVRGIDECRNDGTQHLTLGLGQNVHTNVGWCKHEYCREYLGAVTQERVSE